MHLPEMNWKSSITCITRQSEPYLSAVHHKVFLKQRIKKGRRLTSSCAYCRNVIFHLLDANECMVMQTLEL